MRFARHFRFITTPNTLYVYTILILILARCNCMNQFSRTELLIGTEAMERLHRSRVAVFGVGGVGGYVVEALARSDVGMLDLIDSDVASLTNLNRQIIATHATLGMRKVDAAAARVHDICPEIPVNRHACFFLPENADDFDFFRYDYMVDAVDIVSIRVEIVLRSRTAGAAVISPMDSATASTPAASTWRTSTIRRSFHARQGFASGGSSTEAPDRSPHFSPCKNGTAPHGCFYPGQSRFAFAIGGL